MSFDFCCSICNLRLETIFIRCAECPSFMVVCLDCFAQGNETTSHKSNHAYSVVNLNQIKTFSNWSIGDEVCLFEDTQQLNAQNWPEISNRLTNERNDSSRFSELECKDHFEDWLSVLYAEQADKSDCITDVQLFMCDSSYRMRENDTNPPRPSVHSQQYRRMSGYRAARGDFETEYQNDYEMKYISDLDFYDSSQLASFHDDDNEEDEEIEPCTSQESVMSEEFNDCLKLSIIKSYRDIIAERYKRKEFIRNFGLLNELALNSMNNHYVLNKMQNNHLHSILPFKFYRLFSNVHKLMKHIELLNHTFYLKKRLSELKELRQNGVRQFKNADTFKRLKAKRETTVRSTHLSSILTSVIRFDENERWKNAENCKDWLKRFILQEQCHLQRNVNNNIKQETAQQQQQQHEQQSPAQQQKFQSVKFTPLKIENYPDWDKLNDEEREFCRVSRIQPMVYLRVKSILMQEYAKVGHVTYSRARKIACIDVNKTRKIHNLMLNLKFIRANSASETNIS